MLELMIGIIAFCSIIWTIVLVGAAVLSWTYVKAYNKIIKEMEDDLLSNREYRR